MYKSLERTIMEMGKPKAQLDEIEIRKSDFLAHEAGKMSMDDLMKKYASQDRRRGNALRGAIQGELRLMRDHQKNNKAVFDRKFVVFLFLLRFFFEFHEFVLQIPEGPTFSHNFLCSHFFV